MLEADIAYKDQGWISMVMPIAKFPFVRTVEGFNFEALPSIDPRQVREVVMSRQVANGDTLLLLGPPGAGTTHLSVALGREALVLGYIYASAMSLIAVLARGRADGRLDERLAIYAKRQLLIVDELG